MNRDEFNIAYVSKILFALLIVIALMSVVIVGISVFMGWLLNKTLGLNYNIVSVLSFIILQIVQMTFIFTSVFKCRAVTE